MEAPYPSEVFAAVASGGHEQVVFSHDPATGLRAIIAIWSTALGPALGGVRFHPYPTEAEALADVLRLSRAMGYKNACAGLDLGGGKAVIIGDPRRERSEGLLRAYGRFVDSLGGRYLTAEDVGTTQADMDMIRRETPYVTGVSPSRGGSGDPSPMTALGVLAAMQAAAASRWGRPTLVGRKVCVQGVGKVGGVLARLLHDEGAELVVADVDPEAAERCVRDFGAEAVPAEKAHSVACDIFAPCALGGAVNEHTQPELRCEIICGAANNQLGDRGLADQLAAEGLLFVPDFVANAGGVINIADELEGYNPARAESRVRGIASTTAAILTRAEAQGVTPLRAALLQAEDRIATVSRLKTIRTR